MTPKRRSWEDEQRNRLLNGPFVPGTEELQRLWREMHAPFPKSESDDTELDELETELLELNTFVGGVVLSALRGDTNDFVRKLDDNLIVERFERFMATASPAVGRDAEPLTERARIITRALNEARILAAKV